MCRMYPKPICLRCTQYSALGDYVSRRGRAVLASPRGLQAHLPVMYTV